MKVLGKEQYNKLSEPLKSVTTNNLFARSVVEKMVDGEVYVDDIDSPTTFLILHPYGMSLLFGDPTNVEFNKAFKKYALNENGNRHRVEWMQVFPSDWDAVLGDLLNDNLVEPAYRHTSSDTIELNVRVNFRFNKEKYLNAKRENNLLDPKISIVRTDQDIFEAMKGTVVPLHFWNNADEFINKGVAFSLFYDGKLASTAFSCYVHDDKLELGIETYEEFKGKGLAHTVSSALIDYCLENGYEPVWACRKDNVGSYQLAQRLGFENSKEISYYRMGFV